MAENTTAEETVESDKPAELVEVTFRNSREEEVVRKVYPEVAKFITSRAEARGEFELSKRRLTRERQQYIWDKEDEYYADPTHAAGTFDWYTVGHNWDRERDAAGGGLRDLEHRYNDFVMGSSFASPDRYRRENPNSWEILRNEARAAGHKMVVWLVENCLGSEHEASILVKYLPATVEELWAIAKEDNEMCGVFDRYMEQAIAAGLFANSDIPASLREQRALRGWLTRTYGSSYARELTPRLKPIIKAEREDAVTKARAEWDKELLEKFSASSDMNELIRSLADGHPLVQQHLNRSDAAKAAWERRRAQQDQPGQDSAPEEAVLFDGVDQVAGVTFE